MEHVFSRARGARARAWRTARALGVVSALVLVAAPGAVSDDGIPTKEDGRSRGPTYSTGLGSAAPAKQYYRVPLTTLMADVSYEGIDAIASVYAVSPPRAPHPYGYFPPITVRTLAFGMVPSEVTISIAQYRQSTPDNDPSTPDPDGAATENIPVPWQLKGPAIEEGVHLLTGDADLRITSLSLDGQRIDVGTKCRTSTPARVTLHGQPGYIPNLGGRLAGSVDVPTFTGCGTNGEDLSPLITSMVSGTGNTLEVMQSEIALVDPLPKTTPAPFPIPER